MPSTTISVTNNVKEIARSYAKRYNVSVAGLLAASLPLIFSPYNRNLFRYLVNLYRIEAENDFQPVTVRPSTKSIVEQVAQEHGASASVVIRAAIDLTLSPDNNAFLENALRYDKNGEKNEGE